MRVGPGNLLFRQTQLPRVVIDNLLQLSGGVKKVMNSNYKTQKDFATAFAPTITKELFTYTVGIIGILQKKLNEKISLLGTGTLIKTDGFYGILTAEHMSREVKNFDEIGLSISAVAENTSQLPRHERFIIKKMCLEVIEVFKSSNTAEGPDLSLGSCRLHRSGMGTSQR